MLMQIEFDESNPFYSAQQMVNQAQSCMREDKDGATTMMTDDLLPAHENGVNVPIDDRLIIRVNGSEHLVDSIVQFRRTKAGISHFKLAMCCICCKQQSTWHSKSFIEENACRQLVELAHQAEELGYVGVDIQSQ